MAARIHALYPRAQVRRLNTGGHVSDTARLRAEAQSVLDFVNNRADAGDPPVDLRITALAASHTATQFGHRVQPAATRRSRPSSQQP